MLHPGMSNIPKYITFCYGFAQIILHALQNRKLQISFTFPTLHSEYIKIFIVAPCHLVPLIVRQRSALPVV